MVIRGFIFSISLLCLFSGCGQSLNQSTVSFRFFDGQKELNILNFKQKHTILDENDRDITSDKRFGIKYNDSSGYLYLKNDKIEVLRKFIKDNDTMLLLFKPEKHNIDISFKIDSLVFTKGKYLIELNELSELYLPLNEAKYYNHNVHLVLERKRNDNNNYKKSSAYKILSGIKKKFRISKFDYSTYNYMPTKQELQSFDKGLVYSESKSFEINNHNYFWQYGHNELDNSSTNFNISISRQYLIDAEKEEVILEILLGNQIERDYNSQELKQGELHSISFIDLNFDGFKDILQTNSRDNQSVYLFNAKENKFKIFDEISNGEIIVDTINNKLIGKDRFGSYEGERTKELKISFNDDGSVSSIENLRKDVKFIDNTFYEIIKYRKSVNERIVEKNIDTIELKGDKLQLIKKFHKQFKRQ